MKDLGMSNIIMPGHYIIGVYENTNLHGTLIMEEATALRLR
jgi:hypothetical protein